MKSQRIVTSSGFKKMPVWFNIINNTWGSLYFLGAKVKIEKDHLVRLARKQTGLHSFGEDFWEEPFDRLIDSINHEAGLHPVGRFITQKRLVNLLSVRLRAEMWFKKNPEILEQPLYPVSLICGLQRTGTTKLHRLLASDPDNRVLFSWEAINPVPLDGKTNDTAQRKKTAQLSEKALRLMSPGFFSIHPVEYEKPEEDILLLDTTFMSTTPEATMYVPSYAAWLEQTDQSNAYAYAMKLLKFLQYQQPAKRWVLKSPHHMEFLDLVKKNFGEVHFIWTHRNILESLPSFMSMVAHSQSIFSNRVSLQRVAAHWVRKTIHMLSMGLVFRKENPDELFTDVMYEELVRSPEKVLIEIYRHHHTIPDELFIRFRETDRENGPNRFGRHIYHLDDFGFTEKDISEKTEFYQDFLKTRNK